MESLVKFVQDEFVTRNENPEFSAGDTITVFYEIREGDKVRTQFFKGVVIQKIEVNKRGKVRRARIYYFRNLTGKRARIQEKRR